jgi:hypothetical protein
LLPETKPLSQKEILKTVKKPVKKEHHPHAHSERETGHTEYKVEQDSTAILKESLETQEAIPVEEDLDTISDNVDQSTKEATHGFEKQQSLDGPASHTSQDETPAKKVPVYDTVPISSEEPEDAIGTEAEVEEKQVEEVQSRNISPVVNLETKTKSELFTTLDKQVTSDSLNIVEANNSTTETREKQFSPATMVKPTTAAEDFKGSSELDVNKPLLRAQEKKEFSFEQKQKEKEDAVAVKDVDTLTVGKVQQQEVSNKSMEKLKDVASEKIIPTTKDNEKVVLEKSLSLAENTAENVVAHKTKLIKKKKKKSKQHDGDDLIEFQDVLPATSQERI